MLTNVKMKNHEPVKEYEMTGVEYKAFLCLVGGAQLLSQGMEEMKDGLRKHGFWGPLRRAQGTLYKNAQRMLDVMQLKRARQYEIDKKYMTVRLGFKNLPHDDGTDCSVFKCESVQALAVHLLKTECMLCEKTGAEAKKCPYAKALDDVTNGDLKGSGKYCKYCGMDNCDFSQVLESEECKA